MSEEHKPEGRIVAVKKKDSHLIIVRTKFKGRFYVDIRWWYMSGRGEMLPTKKGVMIAESDKKTLVRALENMGEDD